MASDVVGGFPPLPLRQQRFETLFTPGAALAGGAAIAAAAVAVLAPSLFFPLLAALGACAVALLAFRHNAGACVLWLLVTGCTLEMSLGDLLGPAAYQPIIAGVKATGLALAGLAVLRFGASADPFNPGFAFVAMFVGGWAHGLHPGLTTSDSLRSLAGSVAPFAFSFSRLSSGWARMIIPLTGWIPLFNVTAGGVLAIAGIRPLFVVDPGGARLGALSHPAFLAGFALAAIYACLIELYRHGGWRHTVLMAANFVILVLTGARAPLLYGSAVIGRQRRYWPDAGLRAVPRVVARQPPVDDAGGRGRRPAVGRTGRQPVDASPVQRGDAWGGEPQRPGRALADVRTGCRRVALVRLGCRRRQHDHPANQRHRSLHAHLGGA